jgi:hypothetical protein
MRRIAWIVTTWILLVLVSPVAAQDTAVSLGDVGSGIEIIWPRPVQEVWNSGEVIGTAAVEGMLYYYLEYLPLNDDLTFPDNAPWIPATVAITQPVINGALATLDTTDVSDGLYALRLVVNTADGQSYTDVVSPIRVNNERFNAVTQRIVDETLASLGITPTPTAPTAEPTTIPPTAVPDNSVKVGTSAGIASANIRRCDVVDNYSCAIVGYLLAGDFATALALSSNGSGWLQIILPSGLVGWISPTVISVTGDINLLPRVAPPEPLPPPPPPEVPNVTPNGIAVQGTPTCGQTFNVQVNIANLGNGVAAEGSVSLQDVNIRTGEITFTNYAGFPSLNPGSNFLVTIPVTTTVYFNEQHELRATVGGQTIRTAYTLAQGGCGVQPTPPPPPPPQSRDFGPTECFLVFLNPTSAYAAPSGEYITTLAPRSNPSTSIQVVSGVAWYATEYPDLGRVWVQLGGNVETQGDCDLQDD